MTNAPRLHVVRDPAATTPAHDLDAEAAVISACFCAAIGGAEDPVPSITFLRPEHFCDRPHQLIFRAILSVRDKGLPTDTVNVGTWLKDKGWIAAVGGMAYLLEILTAAPASTPEHARAYATTVYEKARAREVSAIAQRIDAETRLGVSDVQPWLVDYIAKLQAVANRALSSPTTRNFDALVALVKKKNAATGRKHGISTGLPGLDRLLGGGLHSGHKVTIAALPGVGKTSLAGAIAENVAGAGFGVMVFSTEMEREELLDRMLARHARVALANVSQWKFTKPEMDRVQKALDETAKWPLAIDDTPGDSIDVDMIRERAKAAADTFLSTHGAPLALVVVDYVQNLKPAPRVEFAKPHDQVKHSTRGLKALARELGIPVLELAQSKPLEKDRETGTVERPGKGKVADSSEVEKCANALVHIWRPRETEPENLRLVVPKTRGAGEGDVGVYFEAATQRFTESGSKAEARAEFWEEDDRG